MKKILLLVLILCFSMANAMTLTGSLGGFTNAQFCLPYEDLVYVLDRSTVFIVDVSNPAAPEKIDSLVCSGYVMHMAIGDGYAFITATSQIVVADMSNPRHLFSTALYNFGTSDLVRGIAYDDGYVYAAVTNFFKILRFTPPSTLTEVYSSPYAAQTVAVQGNICAIGLTGGIFIYDISDPSLPLIVGGTATPGYSVDVSVDSRRVYVADGAELGVGTGNVLAVSFDSFSTIAGRFSSTDGNCRHGCSNGTQYIVANGNYGFQLLDWTTTATPAPVDEYRTTSMTADCSVQYPYIFAVTMNQFLILSSSSLADTTGSGFDIDPPVVSLVSPTPSSFVSCNNARIKLRITDGSGVDWTSTTLTIPYGSGTYTSSSPEISHSGDTLIFTPSFTWANGANVNLSLRVSDIAGNILPTPFTSNFRVDLQAPTMTIVSPSEGETLTTAITEIRANITNAGAGINLTGVQMTLDGASRTFSSSAIAGGYTIFSSVSALSPGVHVVCVQNICDLATMCAPNCMPSECWSFNYVPGVGAPIIDYVEPAMGSSSSCIGQSIKIVCVDADGVMWDSLRVIINDYVHTGSTLVIHGDTVIFTPMIEWMQGRVNVTVENLKDTRGNTAAPFDFYFLVDYTPPQVIPISPVSGGTTHTRHPEISFELVDEFTALSYAHAAFLFDGVEIPFDALDFMPTTGGVIGIYSPDEISHSNHTLCVRNLQDKAEYCGANVLTPDFCYTFFADTTGIADASSLPRASALFAYPNPFNAQSAITLSLATPEYGQLAVFDRMGKQVELLFAGISKGGTYLWQPENLPSGTYTIIWHGSSTFARDITFIK